MKKNIAILVLTFMAGLSAGAQTMYDAINYSENNYLGTARSAALGNAMTAVGGDLGSVGINPAGSAVAGYSTFTITPGFSISTSNAAYTPVAYEDFTDRTRTGQTRFLMPNIGIMLNFDTGQNYGIKNFTVGFVSNMTNVYNDKMSVGGTNQFSSMMGESAFYSSGILSSDMLQGNNYNPYYDSNINWQDILSYNSGLISTYGPGDDPDQYIGSNEVIWPDGSIGLGGPIKQSYFRRHTGSKSDILINCAFNISDKLYIGANLGLPSIRFEEAFNQLESAVNTADFSMILDDQQTYWKEGRKRYTLETSATGIYAKAGVIWLPLEGLRLGAAIQTPTSFDVSERWMWDANCVFDGLKSQDYETPVGEYTYNITTPFIFNLGAAYTLGGVALVSADWERTDFSSLRFGEVDSSFGNDIFAEDNEYISKHAGVTDHLRFGVEFRPSEALALRAGYARKQYKEAEFTDVTSVYSAGLGYSSAGSFFFDAALRYNKYPQAWFYPYENYLDDVASPEINILKSAVDLVFTFGWRF